MPRKKAETIVETVAQVANNTSATGYTELANPRQEPTVFFHVGEGQKQWREAVIAVKVGASPEEIAAASETITALNNHFPLASSVGINAWYNNVFVTAYSAAASRSGKKGAEATKSLLVLMGDVGAADPGSVLINFGQKYNNLTVAQLYDLGADGFSYIDWLRGQPNVDATRILAAFDAHDTLLNLAAERAAKAATEKANAEKAQ